MPPKTKAAPARSQITKDSPKKRRVSAKAIQAKSTNHMQDEKSTQADESQAQNNHIETPDVGGDSRKIEGIRLIKLIKKTLVERDLPERTIADIMGITTIYWNSMANGNRKIKSLGKDKLEKVAEFLGIPTIQVYVLADYFDTSDFFNKKTLDDQLWLTIVKMSEDPQWAAYAPTREEWEALPIKIRAGYATLYERETGRVIMQKAQVEAPDLFTKNQ